MNLDGQMKLGKSTQNIQLIKGDFTPSEALEVVMALLDQKINFHQKQRLQKWELDHKTDSKEIDDRIKALEEDKQVVKNFLNTAQDLQSNITINGLLEIALVASHS
ncbi:hypothetical protein FFWV33_02645 [Flavobacterium faecale]|uniref:Uncharacterized protein n=1 Tax=Flavobacterium faecale TaxID=1355330 RepID=A0A2S1L9W1_9FLAO|nr:hypothetical protein [Flavobacterium faecale]AWG20504.1 hypothetical protein FFWV33_02645 [Flavobacterium faecale]